MSPRRIAWGGGLFIAAIVALSAYDVLRGHGAAVRDTGRELDTQARIIAEQTARSVQAVDVVLRHLEELSRQGTLGALRERELYEYLREQAIGLVQIEGLVVVDASGTSRGNSLMYPPPSPRPSVASYPMFAELRANRDAGVAVGRALKSEVDGAWVIPIARRIEDRAGRFAGAVGARGKVGYFEDFYRDLKLEPGTTVTLMHRDGTLIARYPAVEEALGKRYAMFDGLLASSLAGAPGPLRSASPVDGVERFAALKLVPDYPLAVIVTRDVATALAPWRAQSLRTGMRTLALSALAAVLLALLLRQLRRLVEARRSLEGSQERFALAVAGSNDGIVDWDILNDRMYASERAMQIVGIAARPTTTTRAEWRDLVVYHPDDTPRMKQELADFLEGRSELRDGEYRVRLPDGSYRWIRHRNKCVRDAQGRPIRVAGSVTDIDAQKRAEEALRASEEQYRAIFNGSADALILRDEQSRIVDVNPAFLALNGFTREEALADRTRVFAETESVPRVREMYRRVLAGETVHYEVQVERSDGRRVDVEVRMVPVRYRGRAHTLSMARDITSRKRAEAERAQLEGQLLQAKKLEAIGTLAGGIAHDFNNILAAILGYGEMAQKAAAEGSAQRRHLDAVVRAGLRAKSLVERILAFSRSGIGERVPVHVQTAVAEALELVAASLPPHVRLVRELEAADAAVLGDPTQIHQVVMNLCANAAQAMAAPGTLTVALDVVEKGGAMAATSALAAGRYVRLIVRDTGSGIPAGVLERIFDPFFTTREVGVGTGLGLSLVHGIVTDLGGGIDVESAVGEGSSFTVYLPFSAAAAAPVALEEPIVHGAGEAVLLVDDEEPLVRLGEEMIAGLGYEAVGFTSGAAALRAFRAAPRRFQALLSDESMPEMTGTDLAREMRRLRPDLPIVLMSGFVTSALAARAREIGIQEVLAKPLVERDIARALACALRRAPETELPEEL
jgi:PAS domain S-box-containing protein